jgi:hypothetical protein
MLESLHRKLAGLASRKRFSKSLAKVVEIRPLEEERKDDRAATGLVVDLRPMTSRHTFARSTSATTKIVVERARGFQRRPSKARLPAAMVGSAMVRSPASRAIR